MSERFTLVAIRPLVSHQRVQARHLMVTFTCPTSGRHVQGRYTAPQASGVGSAIARQAKTSLVYELRRQMLVMLRQVLGVGAVGSVATSVASTALSAATTHSSGPQQLSAREVEEGLVAAFQEVSGQFTWVAGRWVHGSAAGAVQGAMERQLDQAPVASRYDQLLLARMMVEVAGAHGGIHDDERSHLADAIDPEWGSLEALQARPPLSGAELAEASAGPVRQSMLAAVWTLALVDAHEDGREVALLERFAAGLGADADAARQLARSYVMDQAIERAFAFGGHDAAARGTLVALGERIGMTREDVERAEARYQRRMLG